MTTWGDAAHDRPRGKTLDEIYTMTAEKLKVSKGIAGG